MKEKKILTSPIDLVTKVLELESGIVNEYSAIGVTPNWDSLNHVAIIGEIESSYGITIPNNEIENYTTMQAIINIYNEQSGNSNSKKGIKEWFKRMFC